MEKVIKIAIENGYPKAGNFTGIYEPITYQTILLDPLFWQALGKGLGWNSDKFYDVVSSNYWGLFGCDELWKWYWQIKFIDHLAEGKEINEFFENLLK